MLACARVSVRRSRGSKRGVMVVREGHSSSALVWKTTWRRESALLAGHAVKQIASIYNLLIRNYLFPSARANYLCEMGLPAFPISSSLKPRYFSSRRSSTLFSREHEKFHFINSLKRRINSEVCGWKLEIYLRATPNVCDQRLWIRVHVHVHV